MLFPGVIPENFSMRVPQHYQVLLEAVFNMSGVDS